MRMLGLAVILAIAMADNALPPFARRIPGGFELRVKVVPGASRSQIAGILGERLKVRVAAAPEGGKANAAVLALISGWLGTQQVMLMAGHGNVQKTIVALGLDALPSLP